MDGHINGISKDTYLEAAKDAKMRASLDFDIMEHLSDRYTLQPQICGKRFVKRWQAIVAGAFILGALLGLGLLDYKDIIEIIR
jgi:hypothetical protein